MNAKEKVFIQGKYNDQGIIIKTEHRKPKAQRNQNTLIIAKKKQAVYKRWLNS